VTNSDSNGFYGRLGGSQFRINRFVLSRRLYLQFHCRWNTYCHLLIHSKGREYLRISRLGSISVMGFKAYLDDGMIRYCRETIGRRSRVVMDTIRGAWGSVSKVWVGSSLWHGLFLGLISFCSTGEFGEIGGSRILRFILGEGFQPGVVSLLFWSKWII